MFRTVLFMALVGLLPACGEDSKSGPGGAVGEGDGAEGEGAPDGEGEGNGEGEGSVTGEGEGPVAEGEGEGPVCACTVNADCDDGNFCNGAEVCANCACEPGLPPTCADEFECTEDRCANNTCVNVPAHARCGAGKICRPAEGGCVAPPPCRDDADCVLDDPCQVGACEAATRSCAFAPFDGDEDGHAPIVCGGDDCDDSTGAVSPEREEECNELDDNCDGEVDDGYDLLTSHGNCGECENSCSDVQTCRDSQCVCRDGLTDCNGTCANLPTSRENCGRCGNECHPALLCRGGACICPNEGDELCGDPGCPPGNACSAYCANLTVDPNNCGRCDNQCPFETSCVNGECRCPEGLTYCDGRCIDVSSDAHNCGVCGNACAFEAVTPIGRHDRVLCEDSACRCYTGVPLNCNDCVGWCGDNTCYHPTGLIACGRQCVDLVNDPEHCGECGNACGEDAICTDGQCEACPGEAMRCNNEVGSYCACGACDTVCSELEECADGTCVCSPDADSCELDGVEYCTDVSSDPWNCGRCGNQCPSGSECQNGQCGNCVQEWLFNEDCNGDCIVCNDEDFRVCTLTATDPYNCGRCGNQCPSGSECQNGQCGDCALDWFPGNDCNGDCVVCDGMADVFFDNDRVCAIIATDLYNCGRCGNRCADGERCEAGRCVN